MSLHFFDPEHADKYGIVKAILIQHIRYHQESNIGLEPLIYKGKTWAFITKEVIKVKFPYLTYKTVNRHLRELEEQGVILSCKPNVKHWDHTKFYHFSKVDTRMSQNENSRMSKNENSSYINKEYNNYMSILNSWNEVYGTNLKLTESKKKQIKARLKLFTEQELIKIFTFREKDEWLNEDGLKYKSSWDAFWRSDEKVDRWNQRLLESKVVQPKRPIRGGII